MPSRKRVNGSNGSARRNSRITADDWGQRVDLRAPYTHPQKSKTRRPLPPVRANPAVSEHLSVHNPLTRFSSPPRQSIGPFLRSAALSAVTLLPSVSGAQAFHVERLRTEYATNPIGIEERAPRMSWMLHSDRRGTRQSAYEIRVANSAPDLARSPLWTAGKVTSDKSVNRPYAGPALRPGTRYHWQVRTWDDRGQSSPWSAPAFWETRLMGGAN